MRHRPGFRIALVVLRWSVLVVGWLLAVQPTAVIQAVRSVPGQVALMVDVSKSMEVGASDEGSRAGRVQALLKKWSSGATETGVRLYTFGDQLAPAELSSLARDFPATAQHSRLGQALEALKAQAKGDSLGAVVVISDGVDPDLSDWLRTDPSLPFAVHTVAVTDSLQARDDQISLKVDPIVFLRETSELRIEVRSSGSNVRSLPVQVMQGERVLQQVSVPLDGRGRGGVTVPVHPDRIGSQLLRASIPVAEGERIVENNEATTFLRVVRDKVRVLLVAGRPSWDVRFLRSLFKERPAVDLVSFFIMRTGTDLAGANTDELALIPFPTDELFQEHLRSFDLVILQNFAFGPYRMEKYLPAIRDYVLAGGGFAMVGGDQAFAGGMYQGTPIEQILPVALPALGLDREAQVSSQLFVPTVSQEFQRHPVLERLVGSRQSVQGLRPLAPLAGINLTTARDGDQALLLHPSERDEQGHPRPVLALGRRGKGRVAALLADSSYRWGFTEGGRNGDGSAYERFWDRLSRWLIQDPLLHPAQLTIDREEVLPGSQIEVRGLLRDQDYEPLGGRVTWTLLDSERQPLREEHLRVGADGEIRWTFTAPLKGGGYAIRVRTDDSGDLANTWFVVAQNRQELTDTAAQPQRLASVARRFNGRAVNLASQPRLVEFTTEEVERPDVASNRLVAGPWALALFVLVAGCEWVLRRRFGLR